MPQEELELLAEQGLDISCLQNITDPASLAKLAESVGGVQNLYQIL